MQSQIILIQILNPLTLKTTDKECYFRSWIQFLLGDSPVDTRFAIYPDRVKVEQDKTHVFGEDHPQTFSLYVLLHHSINFLGCKGSSISISLSWINNLEMNVKTVSSKTSEKRLKVAI